MRDGVALHEAFYRVDAVEAPWNTGRDERPNLGYKVPYRQGYFPCPPTDHLHDLRSEMMRLMMECGRMMRSHAMAWRAEKPYLRMMASTLLTKLLTCVALFSVTVPFWPPKESTTFLPLARALATHSLLSWCT